MASEGEVSSITNLLITQTNTSPVHACLSSSSPNTPSASSSGSLWWECPDNYINNPSRVMKYVPTPEVQD